MTGGGDLRIMRAGDRALLVAPRDPAELNGMIDRLRTGAVEGIQDFLPAAATVLITLEADADTTSVDRALRQMLLDHAAPTSSGEIGDVDELTIPVRYDGADLDEVAALLGVGVEEVIARHTGIVWRCGSSDSLPGSAICGLRAPRSLCHAERNPGRPSRPARSVWPTGTARCIPARPPVGGS